MTQPAEGQQDQADDVPVHPNFIHIPSFFGEFVGAVFGFSVLAAIGAGIVWWIWSFRAATITLGVLFPLFVWLAATVASDAVSHAKQKKREAEEAVAKREEAKKAAAEALARLAAENEAQLRVLLAQKFGEEIAERIIARDIWLGATMEMMEYSLGKPEAQDEKVMKTRTRTTWKWDSRGKGRYALRVMFEDGVCSGWEDQRDGHS